MHRFRSFVPNLEPNRGLSSRNRPPALPPELLNGYELHLLSEWFHAHGRGNGQVRALALRDQDIRQWVLDEESWAQRHGRRHLSGGRFTAQTSENPFSDYLAWRCPCGAELPGGRGIGIEGVLYHKDGRTPKALLFRFHCLCCGLRDFFKVEVDEQDRYGTGSVESAEKWPREGGKCKYEHLDPDEPDLESVSSSEEEGSR